VPPFHAPLGKPPNHPETTQKPPTLKSHEKMGGGDFDGTAQLGSKFALH